MFCLVFLLGIDLIARLPAVVLFPSGSGINQTYRKAAWLRSQAPAQVLILGDSTAHRGIEARNFGSATDSRALNGAISSGSPILMRTMVEGLPWRPERIVLGNSALMISDSLDAEIHEIEVAHVRERQALQGFAPGLLGTVWATYRRRLALRSDLKALLLGFATHRWPDRARRDYGVQDGVSLVEDDDGCLPFPMQQPIDEEHAKKLWAFWTGYGKPPKTGVRAQALRSLAAEWRRQHIQITYVVMPMASPLRRVADTDSVSRDFEVHVLADIAQEFGGQLLDCRDAVPDDGFSDVSHLRPGPWRDRFTRALARAIQAGSPTCGGGGG